MNPKYYSSPAGKGNNLRPIFFLISIDLTMLPVTFTGRGQLYAFAWRD
jgi:hypothetical protein